ncbi:ATP-dependent RNA helicase RhlE [Candidatus Sulfotelmatobacter kueseliae]|uniref:ATP-dependent RNA helicase RhlE n=1 Tax=Candidatus Sulfotelmatobacter kueseliae TaxID=2042962 RepID=A0A2U3JY85_9BACT|nr:ATP-dependent RNA helicase RhlE [Candidatus Sulfotelmatobacter kueseliae]
MTTFSELPLSPALQRGLAAAQFTNLTPIQESAIPPALEGRDVIGTAQTGTGKTLAFLIPLIETLHREPSRHTTALVLLPTRELAMQVHEQYEQLSSKAMPKAALVIGGVSEKAQIQGLRAGCGLVIATPGRLQDLMSRKFADLRYVKMLVLDEADRMLDMGFLPAIQRILSALPQQRQTLCFSATLEQSVAGLVNDYMREPVRVALGSVLKPAESVQLKAYEVRPGEKLDVLRQLLYSEKGQTLIFTRTKRGAERLANELVRDGFAAAMIHGDRSQSQRNGALSGFQEGRFQVLVATDIASRGLHVDDVAHVINYDLPKMAEDFIHRVGRTGRAGLQGRASTLVAGAEVLELRHIERSLQLRMERKQIDAETAEPPRRTIQNTLVSRTLTALPGEVFV